MASPRINKDGTKSTPILERGSMVPTGYTGDPRLILGGTGSKPNPYGIDVRPAPEGVIFNNPNPVVRPGSTPSAPDPRKMRDMQRTQRRADRAAKRAARQQARQQRINERRAARGLEPRSFFEGGSVRGNKSNFGTTDYRKTGTTTHTSVRSRKK